MTEANTGYPMLSELRAVLDSPLATEPVDAFRGKSAKGYAIVKRRLANARVWIEEAEQRLRDAEGDEARTKRLLAEIERVHGYVTYTGDKEDIRLEGSGPGLEAWRWIKEESHSYRHLTGPDWLKPGPYWPKFEPPGDR